MKKGGKRSKHLGMTGGGGRKGRGRNKSADGRSQHQSSSITNPVHLQKIPDRDDAVKGSPTGTNRAKRTRMAPAKLKEDRRWSAEKAKANVTTLTVEEAEAKLVRADKGRGWVVKIFTEEIRARMHSSCQTKRVLYSSIDVGDPVYVLATDDALICLRSGFQFRLMFNALRKPSSTAKGGKFERTGKLTLWRPLVLQIAKMEEEFLADNSDADSDSDTDSDSDVEEEKKKKVREREKKTKVAQKKKAGVEAKQKEKAKKAKQAEVEAAAIAKQKEQDKKVKKEKRDQERLRRNEEKAELDRIKVAKGYISESDLQHCADDSKQYDEVFSIVETLLAEGEIEFAPTTNGGKWTESEIGLAAIAGCRACMDPVSGADQNANTLAARVNVYYIYFAYLLKEFNVKSSFYQKRVSQFTGCQSVYIKFNNTKTDCERFKSFRDAKKDEPIPSGRQELDDHELDEWALAKFKENKGKDFEYASTFTYDTISAYLTDTSARTAEEEKQLTGSVRAHGSGGVTKSKKAAKIRNQLDSDSGANTGLGELQTALSSGVNGLSGLSEAMHLNMMVQMTEGTDGNRADFANKFLDAWVQGKGETFEAEIKLAVQKRKLDVLLETEEVERQMEELHARKKLKAGANAKEAKQGGASNADDRNKDDDNSNDEDDRRNYDDEDFFDDMFECEVDGCTDSTEKGKLHCPKHTIDDDDDDDAKDDEDADSSNDDDSSDGSDDDSSSNATDTDDNDDDDDEDDSDEDDSNDDDNDRA